MICTESYSYLNTAQFIYTVYHCLTIIEVTVHFYVGYLIIFMSPKSMSSVKCYMFNVHFWSALLDLSFSFLTSPYILFPYVAGYGSGFLMWLGVSPLVQVSIVIIEIGSQSLTQKFRKIIKHFFSDCDVNPGSFRESLHDISVIQQSMESISQNIYCCSLRVRIVLYYSIQFTGARSGNGCSHDSRGQWKTRLVIVVLNYSKLVQTLKNIERLNIIF